MAFGVDYAFAPVPTVSQLKANGVAFVVRYLWSIPTGQPDGKGLGSAEKAALLGAGINIAVVYESYANRMKGGYAAGQADARTADGYARGLGLAGIPIYFACDWDATEADQTPINAYLDGAASVIGRPRTGLYGGFYPVKRAFDAKKMTYGWQTYAWSGGQWDLRAQLRQTKNGVIMGNGEVDYDMSYANDYGQWPRPAAAVPVLPGKWKDGRFIGSVRKGADEAVIGVGLDGLPYSERKSGGTTWDPSPVRLANSPIPGNWIGGYPWGVFDDAAGDLVFTGTGTDYRVWAVKLNMTDHTWSGTYVYGGKVVTS